MTITGAAQGIGRAIAQAFGAQGCRLIAVDRNADALLEAARKFMQAAEVITIPCDLGLSVEVNALREQIHGEQLDVLVNNAGIEYPTPISVNGTEAQASWSRTTLPAFTCSSPAATRARSPAKPLSRPTAR